VRTRAISAGSVLLLALLVWLLADGPRDGGAGGSGTAERVQGPVRAEVLRVVDGDTIEVELDGREEDVRYIGVDTPETVKPGTPVQCFGPEASARNHELAEGRTVRLVFDRELRDDYGRLLAYVHAGGKLVNAELVAGGYARTLEIEPNTSRAPMLARLEERAAVAGRGLWSAC
jgi:micrococcal nuclease